VELQNFALEFDGRRYRVHLDGQAEIRDYHGKLIQPLALKNREGAQLSISQPHDFFYAYQWTIPPIPPGHYTLWLQLKEEATGRTATKTVDFHVKAYRATP
jgi:hypothetical protein